MYERSIPQINEDDVVYDNGVIDEAVVAVSNIEELLREVKQKGIEEGMCIAAQRVQSSGVANGHTTDVVKAITENRFGRLLDVPVEVKSEEDVTNTRIAMNREPNEKLHRVVHADALEEMGHTVSAAYHRHVANPKDEGLKQAFLEAAGSHDEAHKEVMRQYGNGDIHALDTLQTFPGIHRGNAENGHTWYSVSERKRDGQPREFRRNGKTQTWKTRPNDFRIPVKHGMYDYGDIHNGGGYESNAYQFTPVDPDEWMPKKEKKSVDAKEMVHHFESTPELHTDTIARGAYADALEELGRPKDAAVHRLIANPSDEGLRGELRKHIEPNPYLPTRRTTEDARTYTGKARQASIAVNPHSEEGFDYVASTDAHAGTADYASQRGDWDTARYYHKLAATFHEHAAKGHESSRNNILGSDNLDDYIDTRLAGRHTTAIETHYLAAEKHRIAMSHHAAMITPTDTETKSFSHSDITALRGVVATEPTNPLHRLVLADALQDNGFDKDAAVQRVIAEPLNKDRRTELYQHVGHSSAAPLGNNYPEHDASRDARNASISARDATGKLYGPGAAPFNESEGLLISSTRAHEYSGQLNHGAAYAKHIGVARRHDTLAEYHKTRADDWSDNGIGMRHTLAYEAHSHAAEQHRIAAAHHAALTPHEEFGQFETKAKDGPTDNNKQRWMRWKIGKIMKEGIRGKPVKQDQAVAVAYSMWRKKNRAVKSEGKAFPDSNPPKQASPTTLEETEERHAGSTPTHPREYTGWITPGGNHISLNDDRLGWQVTHAAALHTHTHLGPKADWEDGIKGGFSRVASQGGGQLHIETHLKNKAHVRNWINDTVQPEHYHTVYVTTFGHEDQMPHETKYEHSEEHNKFLSKRNHGQDIEFDERGFGMKAIVQDNLSLCWFPTNGINTDEDLQYKESDGSGDGLNDERRQDKGTFDPFTVPPLALWQSDDGQTYVVDGHKRLGSARRNGVPVVRAFFIEAKSVDDAKQKGKRINTKMGTKALEGPDTSHIEGTRRFLEEDPHNTTARMIHADALDDAGYSREAQLHRIIAEPTNRVHKANLKLLGNPAQTAQLASQMAHDVTTATVSKLAPVNYDEAHIPYLTGISQHAPTALNHANTALKHGNLNEHWYAARRHQSAIHTLNWLANNAQNRQDPEDPAVIKGLRLAEQHHKLAKDLHRGVYKGRTTKSFSHSDIASLRQLVDSEPYNPLHRLVLADALQDNGQDLEAHLHRHIAQPDNPEHMENVKALGHSIEATKKFTQLLLPLSENASKSSHDLGTTDPYAGRARFALAHARSATEVPENALLDQKYFHEQSSAYHDMAGTQHELAEDRAFDSGRKAAHTNMAKVHYNLGQLHSNAAQMYRDLEREEREANHTNSLPENRYGTLLDGPVEVKATPLEAHCAAVKAEPHNQLARMTLADHLDDEGHHEEAAAHRLVGDPQEKMGPHMENALAPHLNHKEVGHYGARISLHISYHTNPDEPGIFPSGSSLGSDLVSAQEASDHATKGVDSKRTAYIHRAFQMFHNHLGSTLRKRLPNLAELHYTAAHAHERMWEYHQQLAMRAAKENK